MQPRRRELEPVNDADDVDGAEAVALRILGGATQSAAALHQRLRRRGYSDTAAAAAVERCRERGYVDDTALARSLAARHRRANHGRTRIVADLRARGVTAEAITAATDELGASEQQAACDAAARLRERVVRGDAALDRAARQRIGAALQRRGFSGDVIVRALRSLE